MAARERREREEAAAAAAVRKEKEIAEHIRLGSEAFVKQQFDEAIEHFRAAIALDPERSSSNEVRQQLALAGKRVNERTSQRIVQSNEFD